MAVSWSDDVDEILASDLAAGIRLPDAGEGRRDHADGAARAARSRCREPSPSRHRLGLWKKLERIRRNPGVAVAYHAREHGLTDRPGFVLVQGRASASRRRPTAPGSSRSRRSGSGSSGPAAGGLAGRMLDVYYWQRVPITIEVERVVAYPDDRAEEEPEVFGAPLGGRPRRRRRRRAGPARESTPARSAARANRLPHTLLGWCGADDMPEVVPVDRRRSRAPRASVCASRPDRSRRAAAGPGSPRTRSSRGWSARSSAIHTGWLSSDGAGQVSYAPHTKAGLPAARVEG